jgi:hypothetical protein
MFVTELGIITEQEGSALHPFSMYDTSVSRVIEEATEVLNSVIAVHPSKAWEREVQDALSDVPRNFVIFTHPFNRLAYEVTEETPKSVCSESNR